MHEVEIQKRKFCRLYDIGCHVTLRLVTQSSHVHAGQGSEEHVRRQRLLALTGWSAEVLAPEKAQQSQSGTVDAATAALRCAMCDARAGLWNFVPGMAAPSQKSPVHAPGLPSSMCQCEGRPALAMPSIAIACFVLVRDVLLTRLCHRQSHLSNKLCSLLVTL